MNNHNNFVKILAKLNSSISTQLKKNLNQFNFFFKKDKSLTKLNNFINNQLEKNLNKLNFLFKKDKWLALLSFKRIFIFNLALFVSLFLYLSVPHLYDNSKSVTNIKNQLSEHLNLDFNLSNKYKYNLFPRPNFEFKSGSFLNQVESSGKVKIYISPKYLLFSKKIKIVDVIFDNTNFNLNKKNYNFFTKLLNRNFSNFTLKIKNSNIFYKNIENDVLFINKIKDLKYFYDTKNLENVLFAENEIFNISYEVKIIDDSIKEKIISKINLNFINLQIENSYNYSSYKKNGLIELIYNKNKSGGTYNFEKNFFNFNYLDKSKDKNYKFNGFVSLKPFFSELSGDFSELNSNILLNSNSILVQLLKTGILNNNNLNINTKIKAKQISSFRDLINLSLSAKISEGLIDINGTKFELKNYADFKITDSLIYTDNNNLILDTLISINVKDYNEVYKIFQTPLKNRKKIKKIQFNLIYNFDQHTANLNTIKVNDVIDKNVNETLKQFIFKESKLQNRIYIKNLVNKAIKGYSG
jgi:hypothetical protein